MVIINEPKEGQPPQLCNHIVLRKDEELTKKASDLIKKEDQLEEEFDWLEMYDKGNISKIKPKTVSIREENRSHNRYIDIGNPAKLISLKDIFSPAPYDDNYISLTSELFAPPEISYVNASRIKFDNCAQTFIACNGPKPNSFSQFWHMVIQEQVTPSGFSC